MHKPILSIPWDHPDEQIVLESLKTAGLKYRLHRTESCPNVTIEENYISLMYGLASFVGTDAVLSAASRYYNNAQKENPATNLAV